MTKELDEAKSKIKLLKQQIIHSMKNDVWVYRKVYHGSQYQTNKFIIQYVSDHNFFQVHVHGKDFRTDVLGFSNFEFWFYRYFYVRRKAIDEAQVQRNKEAEEKLIEAGEHADKFFKKHKNIMRDNKLKELTD